MARTDGISGSITDVMNPQVKNRVVTTANDPNCPPDRPASVEDMNSRTFRER